MSTEAITEIIESMIEQNKKTSHPINKKEMKDQKSKKRAERLEQRNALKEQKCIERQACIAERRAQRRQEKKEKRQYIRLLVEKLCQMEEFSIQRKVIQERFVLNEIEHAYTCGVIETVIPEIQQTPQPALDEEKQSTDESSMDKTKESSPKRKERVKYNKIKRGLANQVSHAIARQEKRMVKKLLENDASIKEQVEKAHLRGIADAIKIKDGMQPLQNESTDESSPTSAEVNALKHI